MKKNIRINYIFWKQGPLLPRLLDESQVERSKSKDYF
jgi:hypothetical protein